MRSLRVSGPRRPAPRRKTGALYRRLGFAESQLRSRPGFVGALGRKSGDRRRACLENSANADEVFGVRALFLPQRASIAASARVAVVVIRAPGD